MLIGIDRQHMRDSVFLNIFNILMPLNCKTPGDRNLPKARKCIESTTQKLPKPVLRIIELPDIADGPV